MQNVKANGLIFLRDIVLRNTEGSIYTKTKFKV